MRKLSHSELITRQRKNQGAPKLPFVAVLNNIRSLYNVGSIFRTADGAGIQKLFLCGITGHPPDAKISKTALGAEQEVLWEYRRNATDVLGELKNKGYQTVFLEQLEQSVPFETFVPQSPVCLVIGNEISGVSDELLPLCDQTLEIEMAGFKNSLNVTVAFGIVAYHIRQQLQKVGATRLLSALE